MISLKTKKLKTNSGFTLIELIVVIAIMGIMSSIILYNYSGFNSNVSLDNLAQDIALTIRKAQTSAISVESVNVNGIAQFPGYGVHFQIPSNGKDEYGSNKSFIFFSDISKNKIYNQLSTICDGSNILTGDECLDIINIKSLDVIYALCANDGPSQLCYASNSFPSLDIVFTRPNLDAQFNFCLNSLCRSSGISSVIIKIRSSDSKLEKVKEITVRSTGQISVN